MRGKVVVSSAPHLQKDVLHFACHRMQIWSSFQEASLLQVPAEGEQDLSYGSAEGVIAPKRGLYQRRKLWIDVRREVAG